MGQTLALRKRVQVLWVKANAAQAITMPLKANTRPHEMANKGHYRPIQSATRSSIQNDERACHSKEPTCYLDSYQKPHGAEQGPQTGQQTPVGACKFWSNPVTTRPPNNDSVWIACIYLLNILRRGDCY